MSRLRSAHVIAGESVRYVLVGGISFVADFALFVVTVDAVGPVIAQAIARTGGAVVGFVGHKFFAFRDQRRGSRLLLAQIAAYAGVWLFSYAASTTAIVLLLRHTSFTPVIAKLVVEPVVVLVNFLVLRTAVFARREVQ